MEHPGLQLIYRRTSAGEFAPGTRLDRAEVEALVRDACQAPSSFNIQHWRFLALSDPAHKERLRRAAYGQQQVVGAAVTFVILGDVRGHERLDEILEVAVERGAIAAGKAASWIRMAREIYADPATARDEAIRSASLAAMTMMLAAEARGLAAGALTGFDPEQVIREFEIDRRYVPVMLLAVGHPARGPAARMPRLGVEEVLAFDRLPGGGGR
jgi:nitroreductase